jgi:hypothetical protein
MNRFRGAILAAAVLPIVAVLALASRDTSIDRSLYDGQGIFSPSRLPKMCVSIHPSSASGFENLKLLREVGASCARSDGETWENIETSKGVYNWNSQDSLWLPICRAGLSVIMTVTYNHSLYASSIYQPIATHTNVKAFANFAVATANHYAARCPGGLAIEVFNEPNLPVWTTSQWTGAQYALVLQVVSSAIKAAQPNVKVYSGGASPGPGTQPPNVFVAEMARTAPLAAVDAYALHPYNYSEFAPSQTPPPEQILADLAAFLDSSGSNRRPVVVTEYGFPYQAVGNDLAAQARYVARAMLATIIGGSQLYTHYDLVDDGTDYAVDQNTFGLFLSGSAKPPYAIKPAGIAFRSITRAMSGARSYSVAYDQGQQVATIAFAKPSGKIFAIETWDESSPKSYSHAIGSFLSVSCKDVLETPYKCSYSDGKLSMALTSAGGPVIVEAH